jgi:hypothetical protein
LPSTSRRRRTCLHKDTVRLNAFLLKQICTHWARFGLVGTYPNILEWRQGDRTMGPPKLCVWLLVAFCRIWCKVDSCPRHA